MPGMFSGIQTDDELHEEKDNVTEGEHLGKAVPAFQVKATAPIRSNTGKTAQESNASKKINQPCSITV